MKNKTIQINIKTFDFNSLIIFVHFIKKILTHLNIKYSFFNLKKKKKRITLLKSPHVNKTSREQFEIKYYHFCLQITSYLKTPLLKWILFNKPSTLQIKLKTK